MQFKKQKLWTLEILTSNLNSLMLNFARSSHDTISSYYDQLMENKFKDNKSSKIKYSIILILSFLYYQKNHYFLDLYYWLLNEFEDRQLFELFVETKSLTLSLQNLNDIAYINLDLVYLEYNEMVYVINKALGYDPSQVQQFFENQIDFIKQEGQQCIALERNGETNMSVFIGQIVREFILKSENKEDKKQEEVEKAKERISNLQGLPRRDTGLRELVTSHIDEDQLRQIQNEVKYEEIDQLKDQIRKQKCLQNDYKRSTISLMASLTVLDPLIGEIKQKFREFTENLEKCEKSMTENQQIHLQNRKMNMDKINLSLKKGNVRKLNKSLLHINPSLYKKMQSRIQEAIPKKKVFRDKLKKKILSQEQQDMFENCNEIEQQQLQKNLKKFIQKNPNYGELCLLLSIYNNKEENENQTINIENNLENVSNKLLQMMDQLSDDKDLIRTESNLMRNWDSAQQKIDFLNQMNSQEFVKYHTNTKNFSKKEPSKIEELIEKEQENEEPVINHKKKTLASTFEFIEQGDLKENLQSTQNDQNQDDRKSITDMNEECLDEQNSMRENSDIEEDNMNATELEKTELVKTKNLVEEEPPLNQSESIQKTEVVQDMDSEVEQGIKKNEFETLGFKQTFGATDAQLDYKEQSNDSKIEIEVEGSVNKEEQKNDGEEIEINSEDEEDQNELKEDLSDKKDSVVNEGDDQVENQEEQVSDLNEENQEEQVSDLNEENQEEQVSDLNEENQEEQVSDLNEENQEEQDMNDDEEEKGSDMNKENQEEQFSDMNEENEDEQDMNEENSDLEEERSLHDQDDQLIESDVKEDEQVNPSEKRIREVESFYEKRKTELLDEDLIEGQHERKRIRRSRCGYRSLEL